MEKTREELKKCEKVDGNLEIIKKEKSLSYKGVFTPLLIIIGLVAFFWVTSLNDRIVNYKQDCIYAGIIIIVFILIIVLFSIIYTLKINKNEAQCWYRIAVLKIKKRTIKLSNIRFISIVRLSPSDNYLSGISFRQYFNIYNKYCIYFIYSNNEYERVIGFNNYFECKKVAQMISDCLVTKLKDTTQDEYKDEDQYISSYIRYQEMVDQVKNE